MDLHQSEEAAAAPRAHGIGGVVEGARRVEGARGVEEGREGGKEGRRERMQVLGFQMLDETWEWEGGTEGGRRERTYSWLSLLMLAAEEALKFSMAARKAAT